MNNRLELITNTSISDNLSYKYYCNLYEIHTRGKYLVISICSFKFVSNFASITMVIQYRNTTNTISKRFVLRIVYS